MAKRLGITSLTRDDYGLALALGAGEVSLLEMTGAYQTLANVGQRVQPHAIAQILDAAGNDLTPPLARQEQVVRQEHAYLITNILRQNDPQALPQTMTLSRPVAFKTGTTNDFRDNLVIGCTPDLVVGVWLGNADNSSMKGTTEFPGS
ncbi:MAG TPA: hypothetical protein G4N96_01960 [Chloroflexi bacterium]|nr:hypothetical protein [Chloroflexota bacterium]